MSNGCTVAYPSRARTRGIPGSRRGKPRLDARAFRVSKMTPSAGCPSCGGVEDTAKAIREASAVDERCLVGAAIPGAARIGQPVSRVLQLAILAVDADVQHRGSALA